MSSLTGFQEDPYSSYPVGSGHPQEMILPTPSEQAGSSSTLGFEFKTSWLEFIGGLGLLIAGLTGKGILGKWNNNNMIRAAEGIAGAYLL